MGRADAHVDADALAVSLGDLQLPDGDDVDVQGGVERVIRSAASVFAGSGVGLMLIAEDGHSLRYVASSDDIARHLELAHEQSGEGPCVDAFVLDDRVKTDDLLVEPRWPDLRVALRDQPIRAVLGLPTRLGTPVGTLNLYCERPRVWDESEIKALEAYNHLLEARLAEALLARRHGQIVDQLQVALDSRVAIGRVRFIAPDRTGLPPLTRYASLQVGDRRKTVGYTEATIHGRRRTGW